MLYLAHKKDLESEDYQYAHQERDDYPNLSRGDY